MAVITLSRELGSRGDDVAVAVVERLGLRIVGRDLINRAARDAGAPEAALAEIDELGLLGVRPSARALAQYRDRVAGVIREQAAAGNVLLVGRGGQVVLAGEPGVLHLRIVAPVELRVALIQERCRINREAALARVTASDRARAALLRREYRVKWDDPQLYDLTLNMAHLDVAQAAGAIVAVSQASPSTLRPAAGWPVQ